MNNNFLMKFLKVAVRNFAKQSRDIASCHR